MGIWDFLTADYQTRQARTRALNQGLLGFFNGITPGLGDRVSSANALINPIDQMGEAGANTVVAFDPSYSPDVRRRAALNAGIGTITAAAPAIGGAAIGAPARRGIMETLANVTGPMDDAATRFLADEAGSVPLGRVDPAAKRGEEVLGLLSSGRASEVTDEMLDMGDPVLNARLNEYLFNNYDLPMDEASRMARAREMGFDTDTPLYHGTGADFPAFDAARFQQSDFGTGGAGVYSSESPQLAGAYADLVTRPSNDGSNILPILTRRADAYDNGGYRNISTPEQSREYSRRMQEMGIDNVYYRDNLTGEIVENTTFDPANIRSRFARFDPRLAHLRNLSAGLGGMGLLGYIGAQQDEPRF